MIVVLALGVFPPTLALAQADVPERGPASPGDFEDFLDGLMAAEMARLDIPGAAVVMVRDGQVFSSRGYGFADRELEIPVNPSATLFGIGSVTKPLTAVAALQQVERGTLELEADINTYLDLSVKNFDGTAVTLGSLLTHTSGFEERRIGSSSLDAGSIEPLGAFLSEDVAARFAATGEVHSYSNRNYAFVGHLVERASGQDFVTYMQDDVFGPLGMDGTSFHHSLPSELTSRLAVGYGGNEGWLIPSDRVYDREYPASDVVATPADMATFMIALLEEGQANGTRIMSAETAESYLAASYRPHPEMPGGRLGDSRRCGSTASRPWDTAATVSTASLHRWCCCQSTTPGSSWSTTSRPTSSEPAS